jgi:hypothetical protein
MPDATTAAERPTWEMPDWMERYRGLIEADLGGICTEDLLNDTTTTGRDHVIRAALICAADSKVRMLYALRRHGMLRYA